MLTDQTCKRIIQLLSFLNKLRALPFKIERRTGRIKVDLRSHCEVILMWFLCLSYVTIVIPTNLYDLHVTGQKGKFSFTVLIWIAGMASSLVYGVVALRPHGICQLLNGTYKFFSNFPEKFMKEYDSKKDEKFYKFLDNCATAIFCSIFCAGLLIGLDSFMRPTAATYPLYGVDERFLFWPIRLLASGGFTFVAVGFTGIIGFITHNVFLFSFHYLSIIKYEMRMGRPSYKTDSHLRKDVVQFVITWRTMEILLCMVNSEMMYNALIFLQAFFTSFIIFGVVTLTYQSEELGNIVTAFTAFSTMAVLWGWSFFLVLSGLWHQISTMTIRSWKRQYWPINKEWKYISKFKRSCKPFSVGDGRRYVIRPITVLIFLRKVSQNTSRALCTYGKSTGGT